MQHVVEYRSVEIVVAVLPEDMRTSWRRAMQDLVVLSPRSVFHPSRSILPLEAARRLLSCPPSCAFPSDQVAILDPTTATIARWMPRQEFDHDFSCFNGMSMARYRVLGPPMRVGVDGAGRLAHASGVRLDDAIGFMRARMRFADGLAMPADLSFAMQIAAIYEHGFCFGYASQAHLDHVLALLPDALQRAASSDHHVQADAMLLRTMKECGMREWASLLAGNAPPLALLKALGGMIKSITPPSRCRMN